MADNHADPLTSSQDPRELYRAAETLLESSDPADHARLLRLLSDEGFLSRLDSTEDYERGTRFLRISRLIEAMRESESASVRLILDGLTQKPGFLANETRVELLIEASDVLRPASPAVVRFWDTYCQGDDWTNGMVATTMADNASPPAIDLLEAKFAAGGFEDEEKVWWMRTAVLTHRHDLPMLQACRRLLAESLPQQLRPDMVAVLFDYRPDEWHGPDDGYPPPSPETLNAQGRQLLREIGRQALEQVEMDEALRKVVEAKLEAMGDAQS